LFLSSLTPGPKALCDYKFLKKTKVGIYQWVNTINGKFYIGSAIDLSKRLNEHFFNDKSNILLQRAFIKYGLNNFSVHILEYCDKDVLIEREQYYFDWPRV
jgi:group I intron endonuclease